MNAGPLGNLTFRPIAYGGHCLFCRLLTSGHQVDENFWRRQSGGIELPETAVDHSLYVEVIGRGEVLYPNVFAPSTSGPSGGWYNPNDPSNEIFFPVHSGVVEYELLIYNRWGELVFETTNVNQGWDGYCGSQRCMEAVYVWKVTVEYINGRKEVLVGDVTLLRKPM